MSRGWLPWHRTVGRRTKHWLSDSARWWLDKTEHGWWRRGLLASLRRDHRTSGAGREESLANDIETLAKKLGERYRKPPTQWLNAGSANDELSSADVSQVKYACRTLATYRVLSPYVTDESKLLQMLRERNGEESGARKILHAGITSSLFLSTDPALTAARMLCAMTYDHGIVGWSWMEKKDLQGEDEKNNSTGGTVLEIATHRCLYFSLFANEDVSHLATTTCCSVDGASWFPDNGRRFDMEVTRPKALSQGDDTCLLRVEKVETVDG